MPKFQILVFISDYLKISDIDVLVSIHVTREVCYRFQTNIDIHVNWLAVTSYK